MYSRYYWWIGMYNLFIYILKHKDYLVVGNNFVCTLCFYKIKLPFLKKQKENYKTVIYFSFKLLKFIQDFKRWIWPERKLIVWFKQNKQPITNLLSNWFEGTSLCQDCLTCLHFHKEQRRFLGVSLFPSSISLSKLVYILTLSREEKRL